MSLYLMSTEMESSAAVKKKLIEMWELIPAVPYGSRLEGRE